MRQFLGEYLPIILTFVSGGFFWEFARHMFLSDRKYIGDGSNFGPPGTDGFRPYKYRWVKGKGTVINPEFSSTNPGEMK